MGLRETQSGASTWIGGNHVPHYAGGYVAGRMARFNGIRQGFAVGLWAVLIAAVVAAAAALGN